MNTETEKLNSSEKNEKTNKQNIHPDSDDVLGTTVQPSSRTGYSGAGGNRTTARNISRSDKPVQEIVQVEKNRFAYAKAAAREGASFVHNVYGAIASSALSVARSEETGTVRQIDNLNEARRVASDIRKAAVDAPRQIVNTVKSVANVGRGVANAGRFLSGRETKEFHKLKTARSLKREEKRALHSTIHEGFDERISSFSPVKVEVNLKQENIKFDSLHTKIEVQSKMFSNFRDNAKNIKVEIRALESKEALTTEEISRLSELKERKAQIQDAMRDLSIDTKYLKRQHASSAQAVAFDKNFSPLSIEIDKERRSFKDLSEKASGIKKEMEALQFKANRSAADNLRFDELRAERAQIQDSLKNSSLKLKKLNNDLLQKKGKIFDLTREDAAQIKAKIKTLESKAELTVEEAEHLGELKERKARLQEILKHESLEIKSLKNKPHSVKSSNNAPKPSPEARFHVDKSSLRLDDCFLGKTDKQLAAQIRNLRIENKALKKQELLLARSANASPEQIASLRGAIQGNLEKIQTIKNLREVQNQANKDFSDVAKLNNIAKIERLEKRTEKKVRQAQADYVGGNKTLKEIKGLQSQVAKNEKQFNQLHTEAAKVNSQITALQQKKNLSPQELARLNQLKAKKGQLQASMRDLSTKTKALKAKATALGAAPSRDSLLSVADKKRLEILRSKKDRFNALNKMSKGKKGRKGLAGSLGRIASKAAQESEDNGVQGIMKASSVLQKSYVRKALKHFIKFTTLPARFVGKKVVAPATSFVAKKIDSKWGISSSVQSAVAEAKAQILYSKPVVQVKNISDRVVQELNGGLYHKGINFAKSKLEKVNLADKIHSRYERTVSQKSTEEERYQGKKDNDNRKQYSDGSGGSGTGNTKSNQANSSDKHSNSKKKNAQDTSKRKKASGNTSKVKSSGSKVRNASEKAGDFANEILGKFAEAFKAVKVYITTALIIGGAGLLLVAVVGALLTAAGSVAGSVIAKDDTSSSDSSGVVCDGRLDLTQDITALFEARNNWNAELNDFIRENETIYDNVEVVGYLYTPVRDNLLRIIVLSNICAENNSKNLADCYDFMFREVYTYSILPSEYYSCSGCRVETNYCSGCVYIGEDVESPDSGSSTPAPISGESPDSDSSQSDATLPENPDSMWTCPGHETVYCPGEHQDLKITLHERTGQSLYDLLNYFLANKDVPFTYSEDFNGWDQNNIDRAELILENASEDVYAGLDLLNNVEIFKRE